MVSSPAKPTVQSGGPANPTAQQRMTVAMKASTAVVRLSALIVVLALVCAGAGLFWQGGDGPFSFTTHRGQVAEIYGRGLYRDDTLFAGAGNRGTDAVTIVLGIPLLVLSTPLYGRGSLRGGLLLLGALTWLLYVGASYAVGVVAYNQLFLAYVALLSASLFAFVLAFRSFDRWTLPARFSNRMPRRGPAVFLVASGVLTLAVWLVAPITALIEGGPPERLDIYTTLFTNALDMAVIVPVLLIAGVLILRRDPLGYLLALPLLVLEMMLAPMITAQTVSQVSAGVSFSAGEIVGPIAGFTVLALMATWILAGLLRNTS